MGVIKTYFSSLVDVSSGLIFVKFPKYVAEGGAICSVKVAES